MGFEEERTAEEKGKRRACRYKIHGTQEKSSLLIHRGGKLYFAFSLTKVIYAIPDCEFIEVILVSCGVIWCSLVSTLIKVRVMPSGKPKLTRNPKP